MIELVYDDKFLLVCIKPVGIISERDGNIKNLPDLLKKQTRAFKIDTIHRLDRNVGGLMVYSKNSKATPGLMKSMARHDFTKEYLAVVKGILPKKQGTLKDYLIKDKKNCKVYAVGKSVENAKYAELDYNVLAEKNGMSLISVSLKTGRTHQIRVQFASRGFPLLYDTKYGEQGTGANGKTPIALWSYHLKFKHPLFDKTIDCTKFPQPVGAFSVFRNEILNISQINV